MRISVSLSLLFLLFTAGNLTTQAQCTSCTYTLSANSNANYNLNPGQTLCIQPGVIYTGNLDINGGTLCNRGTVGSGNINFNSGNIYNYGTFNRSSGFNFSGTFENYGTATFGGSLNINSGGRLINAANSVLTINGSVSNNGSIDNRGRMNVKGDFTVNGGGSFTNGSNASLIVTGGNYQNNGTSENNGSVEISGSFTNNGGGRYINNFKTTVFGNFMNNGTITGDLVGCNSFTVGGSSVVQNGGGSITNNDFCAAMYPSKNFSTNNGSTSNTTFCTCTSGVTPLPVELTAFTADCTTDGVKLDWVTASEINNAYFSLEKSSDGVLWRNVGEVKGAGSSNKPLAYTFTDPKEGSGTFYYRLTQTDYDGRFERFGPVSVVCAADAGATSIHIFPNPATEYVQVAVQSDGTGSKTLDIYDMGGRNRISRQFALNAGENMLQIDLTGLAPGIYFLRLAGGEPQKIVIAGL